MEAAVESHSSGKQKVLSAFPSWLDLPPGYLMQDWIRWKKGEVVARHLREDPRLLDVAAERLAQRGTRLFAADVEWLDMIHACDWQRIFDALEAPDEEGQRLRSSMPFTGDPFISRAELDAIHERAFAG